MEIRYFIPYSQYFRLAFATLTGRKLSFREFARYCVHELTPKLVVQGLEHLPVNGGYVILVNHYYRPGFRAWWIPLAVSSVVPGEMHWIMASAWTFPDKPFGKLFEKISRFWFKKIADVFQFTNMPPMPPRRFEVLERAQAVRKIMRLVRNNPFIILGLAPEGGDNLDGKMHLPPAGAGRFIGHLQSSGLALIPVGVFETDRLCLQIGAPLTLDLPENLSAQELDDCIAWQIYRSIAALLPKNLVLERPIR